MFPETRGSSYAFHHFGGHEDRSNRRIPTPTFSMRTQNATDALTLLQDPLRRLEGPAIALKSVVSDGVHGRWILLTAQPSPKDCQPWREPMRPMPLITSSRMNRAPYFSQTLFMAAARVNSGSRLLQGRMPTFEVAFRSRDNSRSGTYDRLCDESDHSVWAESEELVLQLLSQPLDILFLCFVRLLEPLRISRRYVVEVLRVQK